jgi:hypothetical protein
MTLLTAKPLARRTVLRGLGAALSLPILDAMTPAVARAAAPVKRFQTFYVPNGMAMEYWLPKTAGADFELTPILEPLAPYRNQMLVLSGLKANWNYIHAGASGSFLTGTTRGGRNEVEIIADVSMDQLLARHFASETQRSLRLAMVRQQRRRVPAISAASTRTRCRGAARRSRCRWSSTRARCSRNCSATAAAPIAPRGKRGSASTRAFLIP